MNIKSKKGLQKILEKNISKSDIGKYAIFTNEKGNKELVYFPRYDLDEGEKPFFPPSPCNLYGYDCSSWSEDYKEEAGYIIRGNIAYDIDCPQVIGDYLPNMLNDFEFITEDDALDFLLKIE